VIRDTETKLTPRCTDDCFPMQEFAHAGFLVQELSILNNCRMFLRSVTLAGIRTVDGKFISLALGNNGSIPVAGLNTRGLVSSPSSPRVTGIFGLRPYAYVF
jgi:hypothetical protein